MGIEVELVIEYKEEEGEMDIELKGEDMGLLIGKRGQTFFSKKKGRNVKSRRTRKF